MKNKLHIKDGNKPFAAFQMLRTFTIVNIGMLLFRSATVGEFVGLVKKSFSLFNPILSIRDIYYGFTDTIPALIAIVGLLIVGILRERKPKLTVREMLFNRPFILRYVLIVALVLYLLTVGIYGPGYDPADFVYAQF